MPVRAGELAIDEDGAAEILASGGELVGRNEAIDDGFDRGSLFRSEIAPRTPVQRPPVDWSRQAGMEADP
jgi:hypothetical protein